MKKPVYILDAYGLIYRSYFAFISRPLTNQAGNNVSAIFGFFRNLHALIQDFKPEIFIAAFDSRTPTFRHEMYDQYKANRLKTPEDLHAQIPVIEEILGALGISIIRQDGFEADDIIASVARQCTEEDRKCVIISGDKDLMQLVTDRVSILKPAKTGGWEQVDARGVEKEWGIPPRRMLDLLSLTGDASDNIPGVKGVGDKTALKLLAEYGSLDGIYENAESIPGALGNKIRDGRDMAYFSKKLVTLCPEVPIDASLDSYACASLDFVAASRIMMREGLPTVARQFGGKDAIEAEGKPSAQETGTPHASRIAMPGTPAEQGRFIAPLSTDLPRTAPTVNEGDYRTLTDRAELAALIDAAISQGHAAFDCETTGLSVHSDTLVGFSLSLTPGTGWYIPLRAPQAELGEESPPVMDMQDAMHELSRLFVSSSTEVVLHNAKFDLQVLSRAHVFSSMKNGRPECVLFDTMLAAWLLDPDWGSFSLESLALSHLGLETRSYAEVVPKGKTFADVSVEAATRYAAEDTDLTLKLYHLFRPKLSEAGLETLFRSMEMPLVPILADMESAGIRLVREELASFSVELEREIRATETEIFSITGHEFNIASPKQLQEILFVERKLQPGKKTKTGYSTDTSVLEDLASEDILPGKILDYRALAKLKSTYVDALPSLADREGRVHTSFIQTGTATGRLSSRDPNLQNIPVRDQNGRRIRRAFRAADGFLLVSADYSQIELVILAHLSRDTNLMSAFNEGVDVHRRTASLIFAVDYDDVTADMRRVAKTINFGVMYGMSAFRLANELRIPRGQAASFINTYFETYAGVNAFIAETKERARAQGYVETLMGRRRYIRGIASANKLEQAGAERIAVNTPIQGSAADIVKTAMIRVDRALSQSSTNARLLLQVHDELILECPSDKVMEVRVLVQREMESVVRLAVPLRASVESGPSWGDFH